MSLISHISFQARDSSRRRSPHDRAARQLDRLGAPRAGRSLKTKSSWTCPPGSPGASQGRTMRRPGARSYVQMSSTTAPRAETPTSCPPSRAALVGQRLRPRRRRRRASGRCGPRRSARRAVRRRSPGRRARGRRPGNHADISTLPRSTSDSTHSEPAIAASHEVQGPAPRGPPGARPGRVGEAGVGGAIGVAVSASCEGSKTGCCTASSASTRRQRQRQVPLPAGGVVQRLPGSSRRPRPRPTVCPRLPLQCPHRLRRA